ncbi:sigma-54 dependent transcriptional regulator [Desulforegula conservatrix]|uniref:sigma-54 dependent transcriptional regulator n=1 Tax=Desulforegula conservatrix TaxID=153026 RepID=UPI00041C4C06|nr:sigma-54 dependent transcriptional regulator [Desulforegula conservatrix]
MASQIKKTVLVASPSPDVNKAVVKCLGDESYQIDIAIEKDALLDMCRRKRYEFTVVDLGFLESEVHHDDEAEDYQEVLKGFFTEFPAMDVIVMTPSEKTRGAVYCVKAGASDYVTYPVNPSEMRFIIERVQERRRRQHELVYLRDKARETGDRIVLSESKSQLMHEVFEKIQSVAETRTTVMLYGETGTGKSVIAGLIHNHSNRKDRQFISVHCGAIPDTLIESELFGHEKGAFTGAVKRKMGKFEIAHNGTIFLDEIGTITPAVQIKLLQVLQEKRFHRVGGESEIQADVRIIAATNNDLSQMVEDGLFREDLYYRLSVFPIEVPPLRLRTEDIGTLSILFINNLNGLYGKSIEGLHPDVIEAFYAYAWPGNIRELENLIERAYILESSKLLRPESFPADLFTGTRRTIMRELVAETRALNEVRKKAVEETEIRYLKDLLATCNGRISQSAETAGITTRQLHKLLSKYKIQKKDFRRK